MQSGFLHDIGKAKIPLEILNKNGPLSKEEFNIIKKHPVYGYYILDRKLILSYLDNKKGGSAAP